MQIADSFSLAPPDPLPCVAAALGAYAKAAATACGGAKGRTQPAKAKYTTFYL